MSLKDRLLELIDREDLNPNQFYTKTGLGNGFLDKVGEKLKTPSVEKISKAFPHWNIDYLQTGEGEMTKPVMTQNNVEGDNIQGNNVTVNKSQTDKFLDLLKTRDDQLSKSQEQIDRLIGVIEKLNK